MTSLKSIGTDILDEMKKYEPIWLTSRIHNIMMDERTPWFILGMALESFGMAAQLLLGMAVYPILDGVVAIALAALVFWYMSRHAEKEGD